MRTVTTLNSTYEVDHDNVRFRRVEGSFAPIGNVARDGLWHQVASIQRLDFLGGYAYLFVWADGRSTRTSLVQGESDGEA